MVVQTSQTRRPPTKPVTMDDVARLANVSKPTVSRVLSGGAAVTAETRQRVLAVASAAGYAVNRQARKLRQGRTNTVAVALDFGSHRQGRIADPFMFELLAGVSEALAVRAQDLLLSAPPLPDAAAHADLIRARGADGFIFLGQGDREQLFIELARYDVPFVLWGAADAAGRYCTVGTDNHLGGKLAGEYFRKLGARRWLFVGNICHVEIRMRYEGLCDAATATPGVAIEQLALEHMDYTGTYAAVAAHIRRSLPPDAIFAFSDTAAMATVAALREVGLAPRTDYALVGYNDIPPAAHFAPPLSTIQQSTYLAGAMLVEKLMQRIDGKRAPSAVLPTQLVLRDT